MTAEAHQEGTSLAIFGRRIGKHAAIYATGPFIGLVLSLANVAVLTRLLTRTQYGQLAVLLAFSSGVTLVCNLGSIQGTTRAAFGTPTGDGESAEDPLRTGEAARRRVAGTGIVLTALLGAVAVVVAFPVATYLSTLLVGRSDARTAVILATAAGGLAAIWRLVTNLLRLERRPVAWSLAHAARPVLALGASAPLAAAGYGLSGVLVGWTIGTVASLGLATAAGRRSFVVAFAIKDVGHIYRVGALLVPVMVAFWASENGDIFILTNFISHAALAEYRVASRMGALVAYAGSAFLMAWGPISRDPIYLAAERERGQRPLLRIVSTYVVVVVLTAVLFLGCYAHVLIHIAPAKYAPGAALIPLLGLRWAGKAFFQTTYRASVHESKLRLFAFFASVNAVVAVVAGVALASRYGAYGVAAAAAAGPIVGAAGMLGTARIRGERELVDYRRILGAVAIAGACYAGAALAAPRLGQYELVGDTIAFAAYVPLVIATRVVPRTHVAALWSRVRRRKRRHAQLLLQERFEHLTPDRRDLVVAVVSGVKPEELAYRLNVPEDEIYSRLVSALKEVSGVQSPVGADALLGRYLVWSRSAAARDVLARRLWAEGVEPRAMEDLAETLAGIRREWTRLGRPSREAVIIA